MRKSIVRIVGSATALAVPAVIGLGGLASADTYNGHSQQANQAGVSTSQTASSTGNHGHGGGDNDGVSYDHNWQHAGPDGASSSGTHASTGDQDNGGGHGGDGGGLINLHLGS